MYILKLQGLVLIFLFFFSLCVGWNGKQTLAKLEQGYRIPKPINCPPQLYDIMLECWNAKPETRPTFETLQWRLEDFFENESSSYLDANTFSNPD